MITTVEPSRILVIAEDPTIRQWLVEHLTAVQHSVDTALNADEGLVQARLDAYDLVFIEIGLAVRNDEYILRTFIQEFLETPIITASASGGIILVVEALKAGAVDHVVVNHTQSAVLVHSVQKALERGQLLRQNRQYRQQLEAANAELERSLELLQEDQEAGRRVQSKLLPASPFISGNCHITHRIFPSLYLSGDFIDYFKVGEGKLGFYLADVSGHGAASAFVTVFLKAVTNRLQKHYEKKVSVSYVSPARVLAEINAELLTMRMGKHLTMFCGVIDFENQRLTYSVAAHYPPPLLLQGGEVLSLTGRGLPLGLFKEVHYDEHVVELSKQFLLFAASDGVLEVLPKGSANEKEKQLQEIAMQVNNVDDVVAALRLSPDAALPDDVALLVIRWDA